MLPDVLLLDGPELGLHPVAVALIGDMIKALSGDLQIIVATQSPLLVDVFDLDEIVVLDLHNGSTTVRRLDPDAYREWLDDSFTPGELWQKNLLGGRPRSVSPYRWRDRRKRNSPRAFSRRTCGCMESKRNPSWLGVPAAALPVATTSVWGDSRRKWRVCIVHSMS